MKFKINSGCVADLDASIQGDVLTAGSNDYDEACSILKGFEKKPAIIARCKTLTDVTESLKFAKKYHLVTVVRGGMLKKAKQVTEDVEFVIELSLLIGTDADVAIRIIEDSGL